MTQKNKKKNMNKELPITIYTPESPISQPAKLIKLMFEDLIQSKELAWRLAVRDISALYRQTFLGYIWAFLLPLVNTATWLFLQGSGIVKVADTGMPYTVYVFTGTILWQIFTEALQSPLQEVGAAKTMLSKLNFPREALIVSGILKTLYNAAIKLVILIPAVIILGVYPDWSLVFFPLGIISIIIIGSAIGLLFSPVGALYGDISKAIPILTQFFMFVSPVVFAMPQSGWTKTIFEINFMTPILLTTRAWLTGTQSQWIEYFMVVNIFALVLLFFSWLFYKITMPILIERMSA